MYESNKKELYVSRGLLVCNYDSSINLRTVNKEYKQIQKRHKKYSKSVFKKIQKFNEIYLLYNSYYSLYSDLQRFLKSKGAERLLTSEYISQPDIDDWVYNNQYEFIDFLDKNINLSLKEEMKYINFLEKVDKIYYLLFYYIS